MPLRKAVGRKGQGGQPVSLSPLKGQLKQYHPCPWLIAERRNGAYTSVLAINTIKTGEQGWENTKALLIMLSG